MLKDKLHKISVRQSDSNPGLPDGRPRCEPDNHAHSVATPYSGTALKLVSRLLGKGVLRAEAYCLKVCCDEHDLVFYISLLHIFQNRLHEINCFCVMGIFPYRILALHNNKFKEKIILLFCQYSILIAFKPSKTS